MVRWSPEDERETSPAPHTTHPDPELTGAWWDEVLGTSYARRFWNVGCG